MRIVRSFAEVICNRKIDCQVTADAIPPLLLRTKEYSIRRTRTHTKTLKHLIVSVSRDVTLPATELSIKVAVWQQQSDRCSVITLTL